eukprot:COSAG06_NODE_54985_length_292_cov_0.435233_1_plen_47_part_01
MTLRWFEHKHAFILRARRRQYPFSPRHQSEAFFARAPSFFVKIVVGS